MEKSQKCDSHSVAYEWMLHRAEASFYSCNYDEKKQISSSSKWQISLATLVLPRGTGIEVLMFHWACTETSTS